MSIALDGTNDALTRAAVLTGPPMSFACWVYPTSNPGDRHVMQIGTNGSFNNVFTMMVENSTLYLLAITRKTNSNTARSTGTVPAGAWTHCCAVFTSATERIVYRNFTDKIIDTGQNAPSAPDKTSIGQRGDNAARFPGYVAEACIWNAALTDAQVELLNGGAHPRTVLPENIVAYWPLYSIGSTVQDLSGNENHLTVVGSPTTADHVPRVSQDVFRVAIASSPVSGGTIHEGSATSQGAAQTGGAGCAALSGKSTAQGVASVVVAAWLALAAAVSSGGIASTYADGYVGGFAYGSSESRGSSQTSGDANLAHGAIVSCSGNGSTSADGYVIGLAYGTTTSHGEAQTSGAANLAHGGTVSCSGIGSTSADGAVISGGVTLGSGTAQGTSATDSGYYIVIGGMPVHVPGEVIVRGGFATAGGEASTSADGTVVSGGVVTGEVTAQGVASASADGDVVTFGIAYGTVTAQGVASVGGAANLVHGGSLDCSGAAETGGDGYIVSGGIVSASASSQGIAYASAIGRSVSVATIFTRSAPVDIGLKSRTVLTGGR